jgi:metalloprotease
MKTKFLKIVTIAFLFGLNSINAQINLGDKALGSLAKAYKGFTFSDEEASAMATEAVAKMDKDNPVAGPKDPYTIRLNKVFGRHKAENGLTLNFKVYKVKEINAFACADGSVRVFSGLMDAMDDNELLAVIGHEIGHVANHDTRDAIKAAYKKEALVDAVSSQNDKINALSEGQLGKIGNALIDSKHSRTQESDADNYSYDFMKRNGYNVNAVESAFNLLASLSGGTESSIIDRMMSSHPDAKERAAEAKAKAEADGLYKPYVKTSKGKAKAAPKKKK